MKIESIEDIKTWVAENPDHKMTPIWRKKLSDVDNGWYVDFGDFAWDAELECEDGVDWQDWLNTLSKSDWELILNSLVMSLKHTQVLIKESKNSYSDDLENLTLIEGHTEEVIEKVRKQITRN